MMSRITLELAAYSVVSLLAIGLRLWNLGTMPLQPSESAPAFQSWLLSQGFLATVQEGGLLHYGNAFLLLLFGASDAVPRVLPAVAGSIVVALPYYFRQYLGSHGAIVAAVFLAISPMMLFFSRYVGSGMLAATLSVALVVCLVRYAQTKKDRYPYLIAGILGILVNSGAAAYLNLAVFLAFGAGLVILAFLLRRISHPSKLARVPRGEPLPGGDGQGGRTKDLSPEDRSQPANEGQIDQWLRPLWPASKLLRNCALLFGCVVLVVGTGGLTNLHGLQEGLVDQLALGLAPSSAIIGAPYAFYAQLMVVYEVAVVVFATVNVLYSSRPRGMLFWFLVWWAAASLVALSAMPQKSAVLAVQPLVPTTLLAAELAGSLIDWAWRARPTGLITAVGIVTLPPLLLLTFVLSRFSMPGEQFPAPLVVIALLVILVAVAGCVRWRGPLEASRAYGILALFLLTAIGLHTASNLNYQSTLNPTELVASRATFDDVRTLAGDVTQVMAASDAVNRKRGIQVEPAFKGLLDWYLRGREGIANVRATEGRPLVVVGRSDTALPAGDYAMQRYTVGARWAPRTLDFARLWRWLVYRESLDPIQNEEVTVYVSL